MPVGQRQGGGVSDIDVDSSTEKGRNAAKE